DLVFYGSEDQLEYDLSIAPHVDAAGMIRMRLTGADDLQVAENGELVFRAGTEVLRYHRPLAYQWRNNHKQTVYASYQILPGNLVGFRLGEYDHTRSLVIDPLLTFSTYLGGSVSDFGTAIATDTAGAIYIIGSTNSPDFPAKNPIQANLKGT